MSERIVTIGDDEVEVTISTSGERTRAVESDGTVVELAGIDDQEAIVLIDGRRQLLPYLIRNGEVEFLYQGERFRATVGEKNARRRSKHRDHSLSAPMPGLVLKLFVAAGDRVEKGAPLLILEAMKMEHQIAAPYDGTVVKLSCSAGQLVQPGVDLIEIEPEGET